MRTARLAVGWSKPQFFAWKRPFALDGTPNPNYKPKFAKAVQDVIASYAASYQRKADGQARKQALTSTKKVRSLLRKNLQPENRRFAGGLSSRETAAISRKIARLEAKAPVKKNGNGSR